MQKAMRSFWPMGCKYLLLHLFNRKYVQHDPRCATKSFFVLLHKQTRKAVHGQLVASGPLGIYQKLPIWFPSNQFLRIRWMRDLREQKTNWMVLAQTKSATVPNSVWKAERVWKINFPEAAFTWMEPLSKFWKVTKRQKIWVLVAQRLPSALEIFPVRISLSSKLKMKKQIQIYEKS